MIAYLEGQILGRDENKVYIKTNSGVGYEVHCHLGASKEAKIFISQIIREKSHDLYGFNTIEDKKFFERLLGVNGVGPKSAYSLVQTHGVNQIHKAIVLEDLALLKKAPGIGPKAAKQIILDLKDKLSDLNLSLTNINSSGDQANINQMTNPIWAEALVALKGLGFQEQDLTSKLAEFINDKPYQRAEDLIKDVLKQMN